MCIQPYYAKVLGINNLDRLRHSGATPRSISPVSRTTSARSSDVQHEAPDDDNPQSRTHLIGRFAWEQQESLAELPDTQEHIWPGVSVSRAPDDLGQYHSTDTSKDDVSAHKLAANQNRRVWLHSAWIFLAVHCNRLRQAFDQSPWTWDVLARLFAGALFAADITILAVYDGSTLSKWQAGISINTIVSTISTVAMFTLMNPLGGAIGQCKWISFRTRYQPLIHYAHLDSASRGPYGCLKLFWERKWYGKLPALGATLMIMTLAVNPFMQQLIRVDIRDSATTGAFLPIATKHAANGGGSLAPDLRLKAAAYSGFVGPLDSTYNVNAVCHSGNCTWPQFNTLGVCSSCTNITEQIKGSDDIMSLRNGLHLNAVTAFFGAHMGQQTYLNVTTTKNLYQHSYSGIGEYSMYNPNNMSLVYADRGSLIIDFLALRAPYGNLDARVAHECVLQYCVETLIAAQVSGELVETEVSSWMNNTEPARLFADDAVLTTPVEDPDSNYELESTASEYVLKPPEQDHGFTVALESQIQMTTWFNAFLRGNASWVMPRTGEVYSNDQIQGIDSSLDQSETGLSRLMANVAAAMTVALRTNSNETFGGAVHTNEAYIHIRWPWIALPLAIYLLVVAFLAKIALAGRSGGQSVQVWKNSGISAMLHGLEAESLRRKLGSLDKQSDIDSAAKDLVVRLMPGDNGLRFKVQEDSGQVLNDW